VRGDAVEAAQQLLCVADDEAGMDGAFDPEPTEPSRRAGAAG